MQTESGATMPRCRFARTGLCVVLGIGLGSGAALVIQGQGREASPPVPPDILAAKGPAPSGVVAFEEHVAGGLAGCGFLLRLPRGEVVGITTAHSLPGRKFQPLEFRPAGVSRVIASFSRLYVPLATRQPFGGMTADYVLMRPDAIPTTSVILDPDPRGEPQLGERVSLYSCLGGRGGGQRILHGTVERLSGGGAWVRMDEVFHAGLMSGSPMLSQYTGKVVGVTISMLVAPGPLRIGMMSIRVVVGAAS